MLLVVGTGWSFRGQDAGSPSIDSRYGGDRGRSLGASSAPRTAQTMFRKALLGDARFSAGGTGAERLKLPFELLRPAEDLPAEIGRL
jgi:hypothetical protein